MFTGRFGPGKGEVLFDRICRENGVRHLLTAPRSPTTTGKVERFYKTIKKELLADRRFESLEEAQAVVDGWVVEYNTVRPHQGIGMVSPIRRFELAVAEPFELVTGDDQPEIPEPEEMLVEEPHRVTRKIGRDGRISLANFRYHVGRWLAGETVDVTITVDDLVEVTYRGVLAPPTPDNTHPKPNLKYGDDNLGLGLSGRPRWASRWCGKSTRQVASASPVSATGSATPTVGRMSKYG